MVQDSLLMILYNMILPEDQLHQEFLFHELKFAEPTRGCNKVSPETEPGSTRQVLAADMGGLVGAGGSESIKNTCLLHDIRMLYILY